MATAGPSYPTSASSAGDGDVAWTNPGNVYADDTNYATAAIYGFDITDTLSMVTFGFAIPAGATIDGIEVSINRRESSTAANMKDYSLYLLKAGTVAGSDYASATEWPSTLGTATYGGATDLWGTTWSPSDINNANFGIALRVYRNVTGANTYTAYVDWATITVYYTEADVIVTPGVASLTTTKYAVKLVKKINTASPTALATTGYAAKLLSVVKTAAPTALVTAGQAPVLALDLNMSAPSALALTGQAPSLALAVKPDAGSLVTTGYEPLVKGTIIPGFGALTTTGYAPKLIYVITPDVAAALALSGLAPDVNIARVVTPDAAALTTALYASTLLLTINLPSPTALATTSYTPALSLALIPDAASLVTAMLAPSLIYVLKPDVLAIVTSLLTPTVFQAKYIKPEAASLVTETFAPGLPFVPGVLELGLTFYEPAISIIWLPDSNHQRRLQFGTSRVNILPSGIAVVQRGSFGSSRVGRPVFGSSRILRLPFGSSSTQRQNEGTRE